MKRRSKGIGALLAVMLLVSMALVPGAVAKNNTEEGDIGIEGTEYIVENKTLSFSNWLELER